MKARINNQKPEIALLYHLNPSNEKDLSLVNVFEKMNIAVYPVSDPHLNETIAHLAWSESKEAKYGSGEQVIILGGLSEARLNKLLSELKSIGATSIPKSVITPYNKDWTLERLITEIFEEHSRMKK